MDNNVKKLTENWTISAKRMLEKQKSLVSTTFWIPHTCMSIETHTVGIVKYMHIIKIHTKPNNRD